MAESLGVLKTVYSVGDFLDWQRSGTLDLRPYFQRNDVWSKSAKSYFIDTLVRGFPVPLLLLQTATDAKSYRSIRRVVDGQQRLRTVLAFVDPSCLDDFKAKDDFTMMRTHNPQLAGRSFEDLPREAKQRILDTEFSVHVLGSGYRREQILEVFARMNSTGKRLNDQELRNAQFHGELKQAMYEVAYEHLEYWQKWRTFSVDQIAVMKEVEFTSELADYVIFGLKGKTKSSLQRLYKSYDEHFTDGDEVLKRMRRTLSAIDRIITDSDEELRLPRFGKQGWLYVLFAIVHDAQYGHPLQNLEEQVDAKFDTKAFATQLEAKHDRLGQIGLPDAVLKATRGAATDISSRRTRLRYLLDQG